MSGLLINPGDVIENEFPYYFEMVLDDLQDFPQLSTNSERQRKWVSRKIKNRMEFSFKRLEADMTDPEDANDPENLLVLTPQQRNLVNSAHQQYNHWRKILYPPGFREGSGSLVKKRYYPFLH